MPTTPPNILILMPDQFRADCLSIDGHGTARTPNLDALASQSVRFSRAYTCSPICMPARSSFLSGLYPHNHGQWSNYGRLPLDAPTYLHPLQKAGYRTCHIGKSHLHEHRRGHHLNEEIPYMRGLGWDDVLETTGPYATCNAESILTDRWRQIGCLETFREDYRKRAALHGAAAWPSPVPLGEHMDDFVGRTAVEYLGSIGTNQPFLTFVGFGGPHDPWAPPADFAAQYDPAHSPAPQPITAPAEWVPQPAAEHQRKLQNPDNPFTPAVVAAIRALYYAKCTHVDSWIGKILDTLRRRDLLDNTAIIFWSDHGEMLGDKGRIHKAVFYESSARVPFMIRPPHGLPRPQVSGALVNIVDGFPTILDLAGVSPESCFHGFGRSLLPQLEDPGAPAHDAVFSEIDDRTMVRDDRHKLVVNAEGRALKLYDLHSDPQETTNLVGRPDTAPTVAALRERLLRWHLTTQWRRK